MPVCDGNYCLRYLLCRGYAGSSLEVKIETDSNDAVEIKTEDDSNITECSHDGGPSIGMFGFVTFTSFSVCDVNLCAFCVINIRLHHFQS